MAENISMTRIVDLPEGPPLGGGGGGGGGGGMGSMGPKGGMGMGMDSGFSNTYMPMDVHPNPYGMPPPPPGGIMPPQHTQGRAASAQFAPQASLALEEHVRLPQRDIPMNISEHTQDEQIQPNYIPPPPKLTSDYIQEYQISHDRKIREYEEKKLREKSREHWLDDLLIPILIGLLYFVYQLPLLNTLVFKRFAFLSIYREDGNFNLTGLTLKAFLFATSYYSIHKVVSMAGLLD